VSLKPAEKRELNVLQRPEYFEFSRCEECKHRRICVPSIFKEKDEDTQRGGEKNPNYMVCWGCVRQHNAMYELAGRKTSDWERDELAKDTRWAELKEKQRYGNKQNKRRSTQGTEGRAEKATG
jgi:hypothetical protein